MPNSKIERIYYSGSSVKSSNHFVMMFIELQLPPMPFVGMEIAIPGSLVLERIRWDPDQQCFSCQAKPAFFGTLINEVEFDEWISSWKDWGWLEIGRHNNIEFESDIYSQNLDRDEQFRRKAEALSEPKRIELRRRLDEAAVLASELVRQEDRLVILEANQRSKYNISRRIFHWGFGGACLLGVGSWLIPTLIPSSKYWLYTLSWAAISFAYSELVVPALTIELKNQRSKFEYLGLRWRISTGRNWSSESYSATKDIGDAEENARYWEHLEDSVMRILNNNNGISRHDFG